MDKNEMARLVEALCEPPIDGAAEPSAELAALRREAAKLLAEAGDNAGDADAQIAALAASLSGSFGEVAPAHFAESVPRFASTRLDVESATAFVEIMERSAGTAPADLVAEFSGAQGAAGFRPIENVWSRIAHGLRPARLSRIAAACAVIVVASAASWSVYWHEHDHEQLAAPPAPEAKTESAAPALAKTKSEETDILKNERAAPESSRPASSLAAPAPPAAQVPPPAAVLEPAAKSAFAKRQPCEASAFALESSRMRSQALKAGENDKKAGTGATQLDCDAAPAENAGAAIKRAFEDIGGRPRNATVPADAAPPSAAAQIEGAPAQGDSPAGAASGPAATTSSQPAAKPATRPQAH